LLITPTLATKLGPDVVVGLVVWATVGFGWIESVRQAWRGASIADYRTRVLAASALSLFLAFAVLPHTIAWFGFVDGRLVLPILLLAIVGMKCDALSPRFRRIATAVGWAAGAVQVVTVLVASTLFQREAGGYREVLSRLPAGARILNMPVDPDSRVFAGHPFVHYDELALVDEPVLPSDVWYHEGTAIYPRDANPALRLPASYCESDVKNVDWSSFALRDWDFALVRKVPGGRAPIGPQGWSLVVHDGGWWLWQRSDPAIPSSSKFE
jgi:hypothetical protein